MPFPVIKAAPVAEEEPEAPAEEPVVEEEVAAVVISPQPTYVRFVALWLATLLLTWCLFFVGIR